jgi:hypothetical protein
VRDEGVCAQAQPIVDPARATGNRGPASWQNAAVKLVMTLLVRDEEDIIATNIEYHLAQGVDFFIATDHHSADRTPEILERYRRKGVLHHITETDAAYMQHRFVTRMARMAVRDYGADWVINNDADEFWWPGEGRSLKDALAAVPADARAVRAERQNFVPRPDTATHGFLETMTVRETQSRNSLGAPLPPKVCHRGSIDIEVDMGNHGVRRVGAPVAAVDGGISILHFPERTYRQFAHKIAVGTEAISSDRALDPYGGTWRMLYDRLKRGDLESYYRERELDDDDVRQGIAEGRLQHDTRLRSFMHDVSERLSQD